VTTSYVELPGAGGVILAADVRGSAEDPPVVLLHGGGQTRKAWQSTVDLLAANGWYAVSVDLRGHGDSTWPDDGDYSVAAMVGDVRMVSAWCSSPPAIVGASLGGSTALLAVGEASPGESIASALVLVDVAPRIEPEGVARVLGFMAAHTDGFGSLDDVADAIHAYNPRDRRPADNDGLKKVVRRGAGGRWFWHWDPRLLPFLDGPGSVNDHARAVSAAKAVAVPTLVIRGAQSDVLSAQGADELVSLVPNAQLCDVADAGHMVAGDENDRFNGCLVPFLQEARAAIAAAS
jgi:pimeloyl-ACP methyl ester carboxylesterase